MTKTDLRYRTKPTLGSAKYGRLFHSEVDANFDRLNYWSSDWVAGTYDKYEVVKHLGSVWVCIAPTGTTVTEPGTTGGATDWELFTQSGLNFTPAKIANYTAIAGERVECDISAGGFTVTTPVNPIQDQRFGVKILTGTNILTVATGTATKIESHVPGISAGASTGLFGSGRYAEWQYDSVLDAWLATVGAKSPGYAELWQATPIVDISPATIIQWTFFPVVPGQTPVLVSEAAGVFTLADNIGLSIECPVHHEFVSAANNSQAACTFSPVAVVMAGTLLSFALRDSMTAPRASLTEPFIRSGDMNGTIIGGVAGDTFRFDATEIYGTSMTVNLDAALLAFTL